MQGYKVPSPNILHHSDSIDISDNPLVFSVIVQLRQLIVSTIIDMKIEEL